MMMRRLILRALLPALLLACLLPEFSAAQSARFGRRIVFIGDSITDGNWGGGGAVPVERNHWDQNHLYGSGYMYLCTAWYQSHCPEAGLEFFNRGVSGDGLAEIERRWEDDALALRPDVLSILVGINDVERFVAEASGDASFDLAGWESTYRRLLARAREHNPAMVLVLGAPFVSGERAGTGTSERGALVKACARAVERVADDFGAIFLPYDAMLAALLTDYPDTPASWWLWDGIHPTPAGHERMARMWIESVPCLCTRPCAE